MGSTTKKVFQPVPPEVERVGKVVLDAAYAVHTELGPGLLESIYQIAMKHVIETSGVLVETEVKLPILFRGVKLESGLRLDMLVNQSLCDCRVKVSREDESRIRGTTVDLSSFEQSSFGLSDKLLRASLERRY